MFKIIEEQKELTKKFKDMEFDFYEQGDWIVENYLCFGHFQIDNKWYLAIENLESNILVNVKRDYVKEVLGIYENQLLDLLKNNKIQIIGKPKLIQYNTEEDFEITSYILKEKIIYEKVIYDITFLHYGSFNQILSISRFRF